MAWEVEINMHVKFVMLLTFISLHFNFIALQCQLSRSTEVCYWGLHDQGILTSISSLYWTYSDPKTLRCSHVCALLCWYFLLYNFQSAGFHIFLKFFRSIYLSIFSSPWNFWGWGIKSRNYLYFHKDHSSLWMTSKPTGFFLVSSFLTSSEYLTVFTILSLKFSHLLSFMWHNKLGQITYWSIYFLMCQVSLACQESMSI